MGMLVSLAVVAAAALAGSAAGAPAAGDDPAELNPVILVPGYGGSQIYARLNKTDTEEDPTAWHERGCVKSTPDWERLYLDPLLDLLGKHISCWADDARLHYDPATRTTRNTEGVETSVFGFGNTTTVESVGSGPDTMYMDELVAALVAGVGYRRGANLHGAPYDFRKAPNEHGEFFGKLKKLVETTYEANGDRPVIFISHSMGAPMTLYFLNRQSQEWKDKYVLTFISVSGVWGGAVKTMLEMVYGDTFEFPDFVSPAYMAYVQRTFPSTAWLLPDRKLWRGDEVLISYDGGEEVANVTAADMATFFEQTRLLFTPHVEDMWKDTRDLTSAMEPPGVKTYCIHGINVPTLSSFALQLGMQVLNPVEVKADRGDGTVNLRSLEACQGWSGRQRQAVHHHVVEGATHTGLLDEDNAKSLASLVDSLVQGEERPPFLPSIEIVD